MNFSTFCHPPTNQKMQHCSIVWLAGSSSRKGSDPNFSMIKNSIGFPAKTGYSSWPQTCGKLLKREGITMCFCEIPWISYRFVKWFDMMNRPQEDCITSVFFHVYSHMSYVSFISHILLAPFSITTYNHRHNYHHKMFKNMFLFAVNKTHVHTRLSRGLWWEIECYFLPTSTDRVDI